MRDIDVRVALRKRLQDQFSGDASTSIVEEMGIWASTVRIDIAVINGLLHGFELKSERDTLARLPTQVNFYNQVFDKVTLVTAEKHIASAKKIIPDWWGIISAAHESDGSVSLFCTHEAKMNPNIDPLQLARLLWRAEALSLLSKYNLDRGYRSKPAETLARRLAEKIPLQELQTEIRDALKNRIWHSRKMVSNIAKMPVDREADPVRSISRPRFSLRNFLYSLIRPAIR